MTKKSRILFSAASFGFIGLTVFFSAPVIFGPIYDHYHESSSLEKALASCRSDELRFMVYYEKNGSEGAILNFKTKTLEGGASNPVITWSWLGRTESVLSNIRLGGDAPFTDDQIQRIKRLLIALPPPKTTELPSSASYRDQFHLAFYKGKQLCVYHYSKKEARPQLEELCKTLEVPLEFFNSNSSVQ
jgi:hypothetical protein